MQEHMNVSSMPKTSTFQMRINPEVKKRAEEIYANCGMTLTDAVNESPKRSKINPSKYRGVVRPFSGTPRLAGRGVFCASPLSHSPP